jgi:hypothetical protein
VRIAVLHHPVSSLPATTDVAPYTGLINAGAVKDALIDVQVALVLHGHMHSQWVCEERWPNHQRGEHVLRIAAAPSLGSREVIERHGYNEVLVQREGDTHTVEACAMERPGVPRAASPHSRLRRRGAAM